jgi:hypothetical protein
LRRPQLRENWTPGEGGIGPLVVKANRYVGKRNSLIARHGPTPVSARARNWSSRRASATYGNGFRRSRTGRRSASLRVPLCLPAARGEFAAPARRTHLVLAPLPQPHRFGRLFPALSRSTPTPVSRQEVPFSAHEAPLRECCHRTCPNPPTVRAAGVRDPTGRAAGQGAPVEAGSAEG